MISEVIILFARIDQTTGVELEFCSNYSRWRASNERDRNYGTLRFNFLADYLSPLSTRSNEGTYGWRPMPISLARWGRILEWHSSTFERKELKTFSLPADASSDTWFDWLLDLCSCITRDATSSTVWKGASKQNSHAIRLQEQQTCFEMLSVVGWSLLSSPLPFSWSSIFSDIVRSSISQASSVLMAYSLNLSWLFLFVIDALPTCAFLQNV